MASTKKNSPGCAAPGCGCGGAGGPPCFGTIPNCFCTSIPPTLRMTSGDPNCNYRMFQSCTLQYGPTPAPFAPLYLGANSFLSTESFPDPLSGDAVFYYFLLCRYNQFSLTRLYPTSPYGSPFRDGILYSWLLGGYGNTCGDGGSSPTCCPNPDHATWLACVRANFPGSPDYPTASPSCGLAGSTAPPDAVVAACGTPPPSLIPLAGPGPGPAGPFRLDNGSAFPGSDDTCSVIIDA